jgi:hypothetical protein
MTKRELPLWLIDAPVVARAQRLLARNDAVIAREARTRAAGSTGS